MFYSTHSHLKGVNIGSWMVLEPWITPSLFYQFLGKTIDETAMDMYSFCSILGPKKANKILKTHWNDWFNETDVKKLKKLQVNSVRIPVGDWMFIPYGPFEVSEGNIKCTDGSREILNKMIHILKDYNIKVLLDLHTAKDSQNGFDNSGQSKRIVKLDDFHFQHWETRVANWVGKFNQTTKSYDTIHEENIFHTKLVLENMIIQYFDLPNIWGIEVLNEPWEYTPESILKQLYTDIYEFIIEYNFPTKDKALILHDSFRPDLWTDFKFKNESDLQVYIDLHLYFAWNDWMNLDDFLHNLESWVPPKSHYPYIIGEWSLALDNCQMWLNGFMDNMPNYPKFICSFEDCPKKDANLNFIQSVNMGTSGTGDSRPQPNGFCPVTNLYNRELDLYNVLSKRFHHTTRGNFFWNFKTESKNIHWNYLEFHKTFSSKYDYQTPYILLSYYFIFLLEISLFFFAIFIIYKIRRRFSNVY